MVNGVDLTNVSELSAEASEYLLDKISPLITIFEIVGIAILVYILFLIIRALFRWKTMSKVRNISKNVSQINKKLDIIIKKLSKPEKSTSTAKEIKKKKGKK